MPETRDLVLEALRGSAAGLTGGQVAAEVPHLYPAQAGHVLAAMAHDGFLERIASTPPRYRLAEGLSVETVRERVAVTVAPGDVVADPDVVDEIEAEKLWTVAALMFDAMATRGPKARDVERAAELMALARAHVRGRRQAEAALRADVSSLDAPQP